MQELILAFTKPILTFLLEHLAQFLIEISPIIVTAVTGFAVAQLNSWFKKNALLKNIEINKAQQELLELAAVRIVRSINERNREALKKGDNSLSSERPELALEELKTMFPKEDISNIENAIKSAVQLVRPEKGLQEWKHQ